MKHLFIILFIGISASAFAQSEWEVPESAQKNAVKQKAEKPKKQKQSVSADAPVLKMKIDAKYAAGAVPVVEGKVEWNKAFTVSGCSADTLYQRTLNILSELVKQPGQSEKSRITAVNKVKRVIVAHCDEEMVFSSSAFARDFTRFRYTIIAECQENSVSFRLCRISYEYEKGRETEATYTAEEWITDEACLNKKGTNLYRLNGKFRKKTVDRKDELFEYLYRGIK